MAGLVKNKMKIVKIGIIKDKAHRIFENFPKVLYKVTDAFGYSDVGEFREAILINQETEEALLFHPKCKRHSCSSFELCVFSEGDKCWISNKNSFVNYETFNTTRGVLGLIK